MKNCLDYCLRSTHIPDRIIDGGSNIGLTIFYFRLKFPNTPILGFEPVEILFDVLVLNLKTNKLLDVEVRNVALTDKAGLVSMYKNGARSNLNWSMVRQNVESQSTPVQSALLSSFTEGTGNYALKLDVEGAEVEIMNDLINSGKVKKFYESDNRGASCHHYDLTGNNA